MGRTAPHRSHLRMTEPGNSDICSLHFISNCNPRVQEVLIGCDLGVKGQP